MLRKNGLGMSALIGVGVEAAHFCRVFVPNVFRWGAERVSQGRESTQWTELSRLAVAVFISAFILTP